MKHLVIIVVIGLLFSCCENTFGRLHKETITTPEQIGKHIFELMINRSNISKSDLTYDMDVLLMGKNYSEFKDSPAELILHMLMGEKIILGYSWEKLLVKADSLLIDQRTKYVGTYFFQLTDEQFQLNCLMKTQSGYYNMKAVVIMFDGLWYLLRVSDLIAHYKTFDDFKSNYLEGDDFLHEGTYKDLPDEDYETEYDFNTLYVPQKIKETKIISCNKLIDDVTEALNKRAFNEIERLFLTKKQLRKNILQNTGDDNHDYDKIYQEEMINKWEEIIEVFKNDDKIVLDKTKFQLYNLPVSKTCYGITVNAGFKLDEKPYELFYTAFLVNNKWKLFTVDMSEKFHFEF